jgi:hypothetical protein
MHVYWCASEAGGKLLRLFDTLYLWQLHSSCLRRNAGLDVWLHGDYSLTAQLIQRVLSASRRISALYQGKHTRVQLG